MRKFSIAFGALSLAVAALATSATGVPAQATTIDAASVAGTSSPGKNGQGVRAVKPLPKFVQKWQNERKLAADLVARGKATADANGVVELPNGKFVRHKLEDTEQLTVVLVDYSDVKHNTIPQPNRATDNSTYWIPDFSPQHYRDMLFSSGGASYGNPSMRDYYLELSSGKFTWDGQVSNWVTLPNTLAYYGANLRTSGAGGDDAFGPTSKVVKDTVGTLNAANSYGGIDLGQVDLADRYDCDGDGVFEEPDGYVDHFGIAHAGEGEEAGASPDTIWSHRSYANLNFVEGPTACKLGGYEIPGTGLWVGDYTIEPENGAVGVFAHEFGHDLGLPDLYDTTGGSENGSGFWSLMSSGSWASSVPNTLDTAPTHMGAWEKLALGWLDVAAATAGDVGEFDLGPAEGDQRGNSQALRINLEPETRTTVLFPVDGSDQNYFYSDKGDNIDTRAAKSLPAPLAAATGISFRANWSIEVDWDYAYLETTSNGVDWTSVNTSASVTTSPNGQNFGFGITGSSGGWTTVTATLPAGTTAYRFRYWTDGAVVEQGFAADSIQVTGQPLENATSTAGWTLDGFKQLTGGQYTQAYFRYYLAESRSYIRSDKSLCGAYNFISGNFLEKQCYARGLLIWYRNSAYLDNDTALHPGAGEILPIDMRPATMVMPDGRTAWRTRWQVWDAPLTLDTQSVTLSQAAKGKILKTTYTAHPVTTFHDVSTTAYYNPALPTASVRTAGSGVKLQIVGASADRTVYRVQLSK
jgi:immune inhibitor A